MFKDTPEHGPPSGSRTIIFLNKKKLCSTIEGPRGEFLLYSSTNKFSIVIRPVFKDLLYRLARTFHVNGKRIQKYKYSVAGATHSSFVSFLSINYILEEFSSLLIHPSTVVIESILFKSTSFVRI